MRTSRWQLKHSTWACQCPPDNLVTKPPTAHPQDSPTVSPTTLPPSPPPRHQAVERRHRYMGCIVKAIRGNLAPLISEGTVSPSLPTLVLPLSVSPPVPNHTLPLNHPARATARAFTRLNRLAVSANPPIITLTRGVKRLPRRNHLLRPGTPIAASNSTRGRISRRVGWLGSLVGEEVDRRIWCRVVRL